MRSSAPSCQVLDDASISDSIRCFWNFMTQWQVDMQSGTATMLSASMHCPALHSFALFCTLLHFFAFFSISLQSFALLSTPLHSSALLCTPSHCFETCMQNALRL